jgi:hypothetical protein
MIHKVREQQMKREKRRSEKEVIHGVKLNTTHSGNDEHEKKEKEK